jgi:hypothetical protein
VATGNRLLICVIAVVVLFGMAAAFALEWTGKHGAATFVTIASAAIGVLSPSALKQAPPAAPAAEEREDDQSKPDA